MKGIRAQRVAHQIQKEVSQIILKEIQDPNLGLVTITHVKVTPDLRMARIFYSVYGSAKEQRLSKEVLEKATAFVRFLIGKRIYLRYTPEIVFEYDDTPARADRIFHLLEETKKVKPGKDNGGKSKLNSGHSSHNKG